MTWLALLLDFFKGILAQVISDAIKTPGVENEVKAKESVGAKPLPGAYYVGKYRLHNRDQGKE